MEHSAQASDLVGLTRPFGSFGSPRLRVTPWQGDRYVALVGPGRSLGQPSATELQRCLERLRDRGVTRAVTPALSVRDAQVFLRAGFSHHEQLHLLTRSIRGRLKAPSRKIGPGWPWDADGVIAVDASAFEPFWQFDARTLSEAKRATPRHRYRVVRGGGRPVGYAVTGLASDRGYLQRLAVHPDVAGQGIGSDLVLDSLHWLQRRGAVHVSVNTQERNVRARNLYERWGFETQPEGLVVLEWRRP